MRILVPCKFFCILISDGSDRLFIVIFNMWYVKMHSQITWIRIISLCCCNCYLLAKQKLHVIIILFILYIRKKIYFKPVCNLIAYMFIRLKFNNFITIKFVNYQPKTFYFCRMQIQLFTIYIILHSHTTPYIVYNLRFTIKYTARFSSHPKFITTRLNQLQVHNILYYD